VQVTLIGKVQDAVLGFAECIRNRLTSYQHLILEKYESYIHFDDRELIENFQVHSNLYNGPIRFDFNHNIQSLKLEINLRGTWADRPLMEKIEADFHDFVETRMIVRFDLLLAHDMSNEH
jgi:hypothetical protein